MGRKANEKISQREYARRLNISNEAVSRAIKSGKIRKGWDEKEQKIIVVHANAEWGAIHMQQNIEELIQPISNTKSSTGLTLNADSSYADAKRVREIITAQLAAIDLKERKNEVVNKQDVYKELFAFGQQLRIALLSIPDRFIDEILAAKSRIEAHLLLNTAIHNVLEEMTNKRFDFTPRS